MAADPRRILNRRRLQELVAEHGSRHLRELISDDPRVVRSRNERRLFSICRQFGVPLPETDFRIVTQGRTFIADFCWPELRLSSRPTPGAGTAAGEPTSETGTVISCWRSQTGGWCASRAIRSCDGGRWGGDSWR